MNRGAGGLQSMGSQRVGHDRKTKHSPAQVPHDHTKVKCFGCEYDRNDIMSFLAHHIRELMISKCLTLGDDSTDSW